PRGTVRHRLFALYVSRLLACRGGRRARRDRRGGHRRNASDGRQRPRRGDTDRRAEYGADPDLHHLRRNAVELVDEDRHRRTAAGLHHAAERTSLPRRPPSVVAGEREYVTMLKTAISGERV